MPTKKSKTKKPAAKKKKVSAKKVRSAVKKVGHSRKRVEQELTKTFPKSDYNTVNVY